MICSNLGPQISKIFLFLSEIFIKSTNFIKIETEKVINNAYIYYFSKSSFANSKVNNTDRYQSCTLCGCGVNWKMTKQSSLMWNRENIGSNSYKKII